MTNAVCPICKVNPTFRKPGRGRTPACETCRKTRISPKHYDMNGVRYGTPDRVSTRVCKYCKVEYLRRKDDFKEPVCLGCVDTHLTLILPKRKEAKRLATSSKPLYQRAQRLARKLKKAGLPEDWFEKQGGKCGICGATDPGGKGSWHIDHDHNCCPYPKSGSIVGCVKCIRGILCYHCNTGLGHFRDDPVRLQAAMEWLKRGGSNPPPL